MKEINRHLATQGLRLREGTIVDASIIEAPSSTKNGAGERDPQMRQTKKGNEWHFGMKVHIGVDSETGIVHSMSTTSANVHDVTEAHRLLHGGEKGVWRDAGYQGVAKRDENKGLDVEWRVAMRPGRRRQLEPGSEEAVEEKAEGVHTGQGGASIPVGEAALRVRQGSLPRIGQEHATAGVAVGAYQPNNGGASPGGLRGSTWAPQKRRGHYHAPTEVTWGLTGFPAYTVRTPCEAPTSPTTPTDYYM